MDGPTLRLLDGPSNLSIDGGCGDPDLLSVGRWLPDRRAEHTDRSGTRQQLRTAGAGSSGADLIAWRRRGVKGSRGRAAILERQRQAIYSLQHKDKLAKDVRNFLGQI